VSLVFDAGYVLASADGMWNKDQNIRHNYNLLKFQVYQSLQYSPTRLGVGLQAFCSLIGIYQVAPKRQQ